MKQKIAEILCILMALGLLAGCGADKAVAMSEYFGEGKKIMFATSIYLLNKSDLPEIVFFFEDGMVTPVDGAELELSIGELAQMSDEEIWTKLEEYQETKYNDAIAALQELSDYRQDMGKMYMVCFDDESGIEDIAEYMAEILYTSGAANHYYNAFPDIALAEGPAGEASDEPDPEKMEEIGTKICEKTQEALDKMKDEPTSVPVVFIVETDYTGNIVQSENIVYPIDNEYTKFGVLRLALTNEESQIYDSTYNEYAVYDGTSDWGYYVRDNTKMTLDDVDDDHVYVDISLDGDKLQELFQ